MKKTLTEQGRIELRSLELEYSDAQRRLDQATGTHKLVAHERLITAGRSIVRFWKRFSPTSESVS